MNKKNKIGYTVKVKSGAYKGIDGILINNDTIRPFDQDKDLNKCGTDPDYYEIFILWCHDTNNLYSELGGIISYSSIDSSCFYTSIPINPVTTLLYPDAEISSDGKFYYV